MHLFHFFHQFFFQTKRKKTVSCKDYFRNDFSFTHPCKEILSATSLCEKHFIPQGQKKKEKLLLVKIYSKQVDL